MITLRFKALTKKEYKIAIVMIVLAILIPVLLFMSFVIINNLNKIPRSFLVVILGVLGISSFFILALIVSKTLGKKYELTFKETELVIKSDKTEVINILKSITSESITIQIIPKLSSIKKMNRTLSYSLGWRIF